MFNLTGCREEGCRRAEEGWQGPLRCQDAVRRPRCDLRGDQDVAPRDDQGALGVTPTPRIQRNAKQLKRKKQLKAGESRCCLYVPVH